jgi:hypothetical protein
VGYLGHRTVARCCRVRPPMVQLQLVGWFPLPEPLAMSEVLVHLAPWQTARSRAARTMARGGATIVNMGRRVVVPNDRRPCRFSTSTRWFRRRRRRYCQNISKLTTLTNDVRSRHGCRHIGPAVYSMTFRVLPCRNGLSTTRPHPIRTMTNRVTKRLSQAQPCAISRRCDQEPVVTSWRKCAHSRLRDLTRGTRSR